MYRRPIWAFLASLLLASGLIAHAPGQDSELEDAAEVSGARIGQVFRRVLLPLLLPFLLAAWIYSFVLSVCELGASIFLVGPGTSVLPPSA